MARDDHQLKFRVPEGMKQRLEAAAVESKRSLNAEIIDRLDASFEVMSDMQKAALEREIDALKYIIETQNANLDYMKGIVAILATSARGSGAISDKTLKDLQNKFGNNKPLDEMREALVRAYLPKNPE
ncbi:Arc family DNA-binding protein [Camelimonas lactis]|nr:Arc family DNA-binding protein [Camelimonas lactis]